MKQQQINLAKILTYSGTLPLIASVFMVLFPFNESNPGIIAQSYSAIIISFLCGIHWAAFLFNSNKSPSYLLITSNIIALVAWLSLLLSASPSVFLLQALCFLILLMIDLKLREKTILTSWFFELRRNATIIVVFCLCLIAVSTNNL